MKISDARIPGMLQAGYDRFLQGNGLKNTKHIRAGFFAGAAVALASQDCDKEVVAKACEVAQSALDAIAA